MKKECLSQIPVMGEIVAKSDRVYVKTVVCDKNLREFVAGMLSYMPNWMRFLYWVRGYFVMLLGNSQEDIPVKEDIRPQDVSFTPGEMATFFKVLEAQEGKYWIVEARDKMIAGCLAVVVEPKGKDKKFHVLTTAEYLHWTARIYFNVISIFHLIVVNSMVRQAMR